VYIYDGRKKKRTQKYLAKTQRKDLIAITQKGPLSTKNQKEQKQGPHNQNTNHNLVDSCR
jgi:hypothetical protein